MTGDTFLALMPVLPATQWHAHIRGLCEYGPRVHLHGEACRASAQVVPEPLVDVD